jgi:hypothetical protein
MFRGITFTPISVDIRSGVPKIEGKSQAAALLRLLAEPSTHTLEHFILGIGRLPLTETFQGDERSVYVGATAYNFLNVFIRPPRMAEDGRLSEHALHVLSCGTAANAHRVFAVLSSRFAFWWWHINGDGFHVSRHFLESIPVGMAFADTRAAILLDEYGDKLWQLIKRNPFLSRNRGRTSVGFSPLAYGELRRQIDITLVQSFGLGAEFVDTLEQFANAVVAADMTAYTQNAERNRAHDD